MGNNLAQRVRQNTGRNAPATTNGGGELKLANEIQRMEQQFQLAMPHGAEATQLIRDALTALRTTKNLDKCDKYTVLGGLMTCAQLGLRVGVLGHAWLLPFWDNKSRSHKAQLIIGYQGYQALAHRSSKISTLIGRVVYANDHFDVDYGVADTLVHKPYKDGPRGAAVGYYTIVKYTSGGYAFWHMTKAEVEEWRDKYAMAKKEGTVVGPWRDNFDEMAVKTTFLRLAKWMPKNTDLAYAVEADNSVRVDLGTGMESMLHGEHPLPDDAIDGEVVNEPARETGGDEPEDAHDQFEPATKPQLTKYHFLLSKLDVNDDAAKLELLSTLLKRKVESSAEATKPEMSGVIDLLEGILRQDNAAEVLASTLNQIRQAVADEAAKEG